MTRPDPGPDMKRLSDEFVGLMRDLDWKLDYSEESVQILDEVMIRHFGGHWGWMPDFDVASVQLPSGTWTSPPAKAQKRFVNGKEDDLVFYYEALRTQA